MKLNTTINLEKLIKDLATKAKKICSEKNKKI